MRDDSRTMVRLLTMTVALLGVLVVGLIAGGAFAWHQYRQLRATVAQPASVASGLDERLQQLGQVASDLTDRQQKVAAALGQRADTSQARIEELEKRRAALDEVRKGPIDKMDQLVRINQLLADEMLVLLRHVANT